MSDQPDNFDQTDSPVVLPPDRWRTFAGWHREASLYREIYARTAATLIAAFVVYVVAALAGFVSARPVLIVFICVGLFGIFQLAVTLPDVVRYRQHVLPLFKSAGWPPAKTPEDLVYRRIYIRLIWSLMLGLFLVIPIELWAVTT